MWASEPEHATWRHTMAISSWSSYWESSNQCANDTIRPRYAYTQHSMVYGNTINYYYVIFCGRHIPYQSRSRSAYIFCLRYVMTAWNMETFQRTVSTQNMPEFVQQWQQWGKHLHVMENQGLSGCMDWNVPRMLSASVRSPVWHAFIYICVNAYCSQDLREIPLGDAIRWRLIRVLTFKLIFIIESRKGRFISSARIRYGTIRLTIMIMTIILMTMKASANMNWNCNRKMSFSFNELLSSNQTMRFV